MSTPQTWGPFVSPHSVFLNLGFEGTGTQAHANVWVPDYWSVYHNDHTNAGAGVGITVSSYTTAPDVVEGVKSLRYTSISYNEVVRIEQTIRAIPYRGGVCAATTQYKLGARTALELKIATDISSATAAASVSGAWAALSASVGIAATALTITLSLTFTESLSQSANEGWVDGVTVGFSGIPGIGSRVPVALGRTVKGQTTIVPKETRLLVWPFGLRAYGPGVGGGTIPDLALPQPHRLPIGTR